MNVILLSLVTIITISGCGSMPPSIKNKVDAGEIVPLWIANVVTDVDSAGGVSVRIHYMNLSETTIKKATFKLTAYNGVGETIWSQVHTNRGSVERTSVGPVYTKKWRFPEWLIWYNSSFNCVEIESAKIEYMNGSILRITKEQVDQIMINGFGSKISNNCAFSE